MGTTFAELLYKLLVNLLTSIQSPTKQKQQKIVNYSEIQRYIFIINRQRWNLYIDTSAQDFQNKDTLKQIQIKSCPKILKTSKCIIKK